MPTFDMLQVSACSSVQQGWGGMEGRGARSGGGRGGQGGMYVGGQGGVSCHMRP